MGGLGLTVHVGHVEALVNGGVDADDDVSYRDVEDGGQDGDARGNGDTKIGESLTEIKATGPISTSRKMLRAFD